MQLGPKYSHSQSNYLSSALNLFHFSEKQYGWFIPQTVRVRLSYCFWSHHVHWGVFSSPRLLYTFCINFPFGSGSWLSWIVRGTPAIFEKKMSNNVTLFLYIIGRRRSGAQICLPLHSFEFTEYVKINCNMQTKASCSESPYMFNNNSA